jgi:RES domain-containing protein
LEKVIQLNSSAFPLNLVYVQIAIPPEATVEELRWEDYRAWDPEHKLSGKRFGDRWYDERRSVVLFVPSLAAPGLERNVLINQRHAEFPLLVASAYQPLRTGVNSLVPDLRHYGV